MTTPSLLEFGVGSAFVILLMWTYSRPVWQWFIVLGLLALTGLRLLGVTL